jgi:hypothetical protein
MSTQGRIAAERAHPPVHLVAERQHVVLLVLEGEDHLGEARGKFPPARRRSRLHDDRMTLRAARRGQRAARGDVLAHIVGVMHPRRVGERAGFLVEQQRAVFPGVPQRHARLDTFLGAVIARDAIGDAGHPEILCLQVGGRGDDVPRHAPVAKMIERGQHARQMERVVERGRQRDPEA